jgi:hypothetical protein
MLCKVHIVPVFYDTALKIQYFAMYLVQYKLHTECGGVYTTHSTVYGWYEVECMASYPPPLPVQYTACS